LGKDDRLSRSLTALTNLTLLELWCVLPSRVVAPIAGLSRLELLDVMIDDSDSEPASLTLLPRSHTSLCIGGGPIDMAPWYVAVSLIRLTLTIGVALDVT